MSGVLAHVHVAGVGLKGIPSVRALSFDPRLVPLARRASDHDPLEDEAKYANLFPLLGLPFFCGLCCITIADFDLLAT